MSETEQVTPEVSIETSPSPAPVVDDAPRGALATVATVPETPATRAFKSAQAKLAEKNSDIVTSENKVDNAEAVAETKPEEAVSAAPTVAISETVQPAEAPAIWPEELRNDFNAIADPKAKAVVTKAYETFQRDFNQGMRALQQKEAEVADLKSWNDRFSEDPQGSLLALAEKFGVNLAGLASEEPPEFATINEALEWNRKKAKQEIMTDLQRERQAEQKAQMQQVAQQEFLSELKQAETEYPDLADHRDGILAALAKAPTLTVKEAYQLATYGHAVKLAGESLALKQENAKLQAQITELKARSTRPATPTNLEEKPVSSKNQNPTEAAFQRAQRKHADRWANVKH